jgi:hypothetical protein
MKKIQQILAFGGSHTAGFKLYPHNWDEVNYGITTLEDIDNEGKKLSYPQQLANKLKIPCINYSMTGGGDDRIMRQLPEALLTYPNSLVLIGWTTIDRIEFYYPDNGKFIARDKDNYLQIGINWIEKNNLWGRLGRWMEKTFHPLNDLFLNKFYRSTDNKNNYKVFNNMLYAELLCKKYSSEYRHIFHVNMTIPENNLQIIIWDEIDKNKILKLPGNINRGFGSYASFHEHAGSKSLDQGHYDLEAHIKLADYIYHDLDI